MGLKDPCTKERLKAMREHGIEANMELQDSEDLLYRYRWEGFVEQTGVRMQLARDIIDVWVRMYEDHRPGVRRVLLYRQDCLEHGVDLTICSV